MPVRLEAVVGDFSWDERSLYFHANWRHQYPVATRPFSDFNYVTLTGRGVYVGDTLTVMNPIPTWWGEGDAKIWVDGEKFPSIFGTGTEDYYGYSWGGRHTNFYEHPFHAQPRAHCYDQLNPKNGSDRTRYARLQHGDSYTGPRYHAVRQIASGRHGGVALEGVRHGLRRRNVLVWRCRHQDQSHG